MIRSMTGFGKASASAAEKWSVSVTIRSVNHRYLELGVRLPEAFWDLESAVRATAGEYVQRGKIDVAIRLRRVGEQESNVRINRRIVSAVVPQLTLLLAEMGHSANVDVGDLIRIPGVLETESADEQIDDDERAAILGIIASAFAELRTMRDQEGTTLAADISRRVDAVDELRAAVDEMIPSVRQELADAFRRRLADIRRDFDYEVADEKIAQEIALMLDRGDVAEEMTRLASHIEQMRKVLAGGEDGTGKKLDFLTQEMLREINTLGQKSRAAGLRSLVVELKAEVERIREQVQNVE